MIQFILNLASTVLLLLENNELESLTFPVLVTAGVGLIISLGFYILKAVAICTMAKKRGYKYWWLGMIPYANFYVIGKLVGRMRILNFEIKNVGLIAMISSIVYDVSTIAMLVYALSQIFNFGIFFGIFYNLLYSINAIVDLLFYISFFLLVYGIFGRYAPHKRILYTILCLLSQYIFGIQFMFPILLIVVMNKRPYDSFEDYYKEEMAKRYGQTYNPFERPYSTRENPFNNSNNQPNGENKNDDPFDEFK